MRAPDQEVGLKKRRFSIPTLVFYLVLLGVLIALITIGNDSMTRKPDQLGTAEFYSYVELGMGQNPGDQNTKVFAVQITEETLYGIYTEGVTEEKVEKFKKGRLNDFYVTIGSAEAFQNEISKLVASKYAGEFASPDNVTVADYGFDYKINPRPTTPWYLMLLPYLLLFGALIMTVVMISRANGGKQGANFARSRARTADELGVKNTFKDVAGADEEKQELKEIVDFLKNPKDFIDMGARIPKGVLLVGPPGTGKTLLARAVAGEANVPFFSISSSEFVELYVGVGASRVRDMFQTAKRSAPAIIFIDEIDAVGRQRGAGLGGGHDEREQTLNQLLVEMDGFSNNLGIIVMAATNRPDVLDPALLRPGRFDRRITVNYPDVKGRKEILEVHARKKTFSKDVDFEKIAKLTPGCTGADLENILNEAAILAVREKRKEINSFDIDEAIKRVLYGPEKKSRTVTQEDLRVTAYHEVGHAVVAHCTPQGEPVHELSIIPRGQAAGYTRMLPQDTYTHVTKNKLLDMIAVMLGGRAAETLLLSDISTGAQNDLMNATNIARSMVTEYGMSDEIGPVYLSGGQEVFLGKSFGHQQNFSEDLAADIDREIHRILTEQSKRAIDILDANRDAIERVVAKLLEKEQITGEEFAAVFEGKECVELPECAEQSAANAETALEEAANADDNGAEA